MKTVGGAHLVLESANRKLAPQGWEPTTTGRPRVVPMEPYCAATTTSIVATCPLDCRFMGAGCFEQGGVQARRQDLLAREAGTGLEVAAAEARLIEKSRVPPGRPLRLHQGGDVFNTEGAMLLASAAQSWLARGGGPVWVYTHRWREIPGNAWGPVVAFASIEDPREGRAAVKAGYRPALVVREFPNGDRAFRAGGVKYTPCAFETNGVPCSRCRLCLGNLPPKTGIAFQLHGRDASKVH